MSALQSYEWPGNVRELQHVIERAVVGAATSAASAPSNTTYNYYNTLPCNAATVVAGGVTYYQCGATWYSQAYSGSSVTYVVVSPPHGY